MTELLEKAIEKVSQLPEEEQNTIASIILEELEDEALWDAQFSATDDSKLSALVASVKADIKEGKTLPMFDEQGEFIENK